MCTALTQVSALAWMYGHMHICAPRALADAHAWCLLCSVDYPSSCQTIGASHTRMLGAQALPTVLAGRASRACGAWTARL